MQLILCGRKCRAFQSRRKHQIKTNDSAFSHRWQMVSLRLAFDIRPIWHSHPSSSLSPHTHTHGQIRIVSNWTALPIALEPFIFTFISFRACERVWVCRNRTPDTKWFKREHKTHTQTHTQHKQKRNRFRAVKNNDAPCLLLCSAISH